MTANSKILIINFAIFGLSYFLIEYGIYLNNLLALYPIDSDFFNLYQLITHIFAHSSPEHLYSNMILFIIFSPMVENSLGKKEFWKFYILAGLFSSGLYCLFSDLAIIGASGCVFAIMGFYLMNNKITDIKTFSGISKCFVSIFIVFCFILEVWDSIFTQDDIAHLCHVIGFCFGFFYFQKYKSNFIRP